MKAVKITYGKFSEEVGLLYMVKSIKDAFWFGLREAKDHVDRIRDEIKRGGVIIDEFSIEYDILVYMKKNGFISFETGQKVSESVTKLPNHRVVAKKVKNIIKLWNGLIVFILKNKQ